MGCGFLGVDGAFLVTSLITLFIIIDPPGNVFPYLALSAGYDPAAARGLAWRACLYAFLILFLCLGVGRILLQFFGISLPAFQIAGGLIFFRIAVDMLEGQDQFNRIDTCSSLTPPTTGTRPWRPWPSPCSAVPGPFPPCWS
jgi:small neutral amino acid transporter SnatA (MarC family)